MASSLHLYREEKMKQKKVPFFSFFEAKEVNFLSEMLWLIVLHRNQKEELMNWRTKEGGENLLFFFFFSLFWIVFFAAKWVNFSRKMHVLISYIQGKRWRKEKEEKDQMGNLGRREGERRVGIVGTWEWSKQEGREAGVACNWKAKHKQEGVHISKNLKPVNSKG